VNRVSWRSRAAPTGSEFSSSERTGSTGKHERLGLFDNIPGTSSTGMHRGFDWLALALDCEAVSVTRVLSSGAPVTIWQEHIPHPSKTMKTSELKQPFNVDLLCRYFNDSSINSDRSMG
jgi:hypothetical protein